MKIKIFYRNYKPLHEVFRSYLDFPPKNVKYIFPNTKKHLKKFFPIYRKYGDSFLIRKFIRIFQNRFFDQEISEEFDLLEFIQIVPAEIPQKPYIVDTEHFVGLFNFVKADDVSWDGVTKFLGHPNCKAIISISEAAKSNMKSILNGSHAEILNKVTVIPPSLPLVLSGNKLTPDNSIVRDNKKLKLLFVGNDVFRKGLHELILAIDSLGRDKKNVDLYAVCNASEEFKNSYNYGFVNYLKPNFSKEAIISKLYVPSDLFVFPTHGDTYGMAVLDSLSSGTPVLATNQFALPEMIRDRVNGILVESDKLFLEKYQIPDKTVDKNFPFDEPEPKLIKNLAKEIGQIINDRSILDKYSKNAQVDFKKGGKFSIDVRNEKLWQLYTKAMQV